MLLRILPSAVAFGICLGGLYAQSGTVANRGIDAHTVARQELTRAGFNEADILDLAVKDDYTSGGLRHVVFRQRWQGIEVWNGDVALHFGANGGLIAFNQAAEMQLARRALNASPGLSAQQALGAALALTMPGSSLPSPIGSEDQGRLVRFDGSAFGDHPIEVKLYWVGVGEALRLAWNVNHYTPDGSHWWNVRIDAMTGDELGRNDWVSQCNFDEEACAAHTHAAPEEMPMPAAPNDLNVYPMPVESPNHGARALRNAPWTNGGIASLYGWNDTNGAAGPEYTTTRGNNCWAQEDANNNNGTGASPVSATLDFDYAINLANAPATYQNAAITNLYYWNNIIHDVWYQYGFDDPSGNFQQNNYGRGGTGNDFVFADAQDGGGTNNANFATPAEGTSPRMQMYVWNYTTPNRDGDLDNCIIAHEYGHGISNRLVGGPANTNCLANAEQMGEGWSDWIGLMMTIEPGDQGTDRRGVGTYVIGQAVTGTGIRPAPYSTSFAQNAYTYGATNNTATIAVPHGIGFVWCTILWEMSWELINAHGFDPNFYTGTGGNNIAMRLVIEGMKLTPCNPGFVDARNAILNADAALYGGVHQTTLWNAFARRGLGVSTSQGSAASRTDQVEAYDTPAPNNVGVSMVLVPAGSATIDCTGGSTLVTATVRNFGSAAQSNFPVRYRLDAGAWVAETYTGTLAAGASSNFTFATPLVIGTTGAHTVTVSTLLAGDSFAGNDQATSSVTVNNTTPVVAPFTEGLTVNTVPAPTGWRLENPDGLTTWTAPVITNGINCGSSRVWSMDHYNYNGVGQEDRLVTPRINLSGFTASTLRFDRAFAPYGPGYYDAFRVDISNDCGASWTQLYYAAGTALATTAATTAAWAPTNCSQWQTNTISIAAYNGQTVQVRFVAINAYGNFFYMDNVQIFGNSSLPVELMDLGALAQNEGISVQWTTGSEINSERFEVERSADAMNWTRIGTLPAQGQSFTTTSYAFLDRAPVKGTNYYRLFMVDNDGTAEHSRVVSTVWKHARARCYPNPTDGSLWIEAPANARVDVYDALGQLIPYRTRYIQDEQRHISFEGISGGVCTVRIETDGEVVMERVVVRP
ncbi:MAG: M36 family metallopeptidase [Flavobacteriales bacterium]|nr:M36 family metallopeptidase [Flavobacteriales bacterium]